MQTTTHSQGSRSGAGTVHTCLPGTLSRVDSVEVCVEQLFTLALRGVNGPIVSAGEHNLGMTSCPSSVGDQLVSRTGVNSAR